MTAMRRLLSMLILLLAGLVGPAGAATHPGLEVLAAPRPVPAVAMVNAEGHPVDLGALRGRPVLVNLWASWCLPCLAELPALDRLAASGRVAVLALSLDRGGVPAARAAYRRMDIRHLALTVDAGLKAGEDWGAQVLPTTLLLDAQGREVARYVGAARWDEAEPLLTALVSGRPVLPAMAPPAAHFTGTPP